MWSIINQSKNKGIIFMKSTKNELDNQTLVADANKQNQKIDEMLAKADVVVASNDLGQINQYLSELKEMGGMLPKAKLKRIADNLALYVTDDLDDITFFIKLYGQYGAISPKLIKRIMLQYNKASEAEFLAYFADMVSGMSDSDLERLIAETSNNPKLNAICKRIKKRRQASQTVAQIQTQMLQAFDVPTPTKKRAKKKEAEVANEKSAGLSR